MFTVICIETDNLVNEVAAKTGMSAPAERGAQHGKGQEAQTCFHGIVRVRKLESIGAVATSKIGNFSLLGQPEEPLVRKLTA